MKPVLDKLLSSQTQQRVELGEISKDKVDRYFNFVDRINKELLPHEVITNNQFAQWFEKADLNEDIVRHFLVQFSVFSNLFMVAQLLKSINSPTLESMRASKEILMNELGVAFRNPAGKPKAYHEGEVNDEDVATEGTVEGGTFKFTAAHFEWLLRMTEHLGVGFKEVGKREHGTQSTLFFCDELARIYGSPDPHVALGASFAVENWAAAGFWKELVAGLARFKKEHKPKMPMGFFKWHDLVEDQHAQHTRDELEEDYFSMEVDEDKFMEGGLKMLDGVLAFWNGLNEDRKKILAA